MNNCRQYTTFSFDFFKTTDAIWRFFIPIWHLVILLSPDKFIQRPEHYIVEECAILMLTFIIIIIIIFFIIFLFFLVHVSWQLCPRGIDYRLDPMNLPGQ